MNHKLTVHLSVALALVALLINTLTALAYPAETPETKPNERPIIKIRCSEVLDTAEEDAASIDIPARRAEYAVLDRISYCLQVAGVSKTIPATGRATWVTSQYLAMKDRQAEMMDKSGPPARQHMDPRFIEFKERQAAERMGP